MCVSLGRHMLSAARLSRARSLPPAPVPFVASDPQDCARIYTQNVAILALGALQARLNELESTVIPQIKKIKIALVVLYIRVW